MEDLLSLSLAIVGHSDTKLKTNRQDSVMALSMEEKIFQLLREREKMLSIDRRGKAAAVVPDAKGLHLIHLLLISATLISENDTVSAVEHLTELYRNVSVTGNSGQRVAAYFADGLTARILTRKSPFFRMVMAKPTPSEEFLAFTHLYRVSPFYQFAHFTANQAILEAFERDLERHDDDNNNKNNDNNDNDNRWGLHVIDFDVSHGFQWPSLMQALSDKAAASDRPVSLRITGFATTLEDLVETEARLVSFSRTFQNILFDFHGYCPQMGSHSSLLKTIQEKTTAANETVAVNLVFHLSSLGDILRVSETLTLARSLNPSVLILVEREGTRTQPGFLSTYVDSLHYYAAMFDSLDDCLPLDSLERVAIERNHLGNEIKAAVVTADECGGPAAHECSRFERMDTWRERMERHGFAGNGMSSRVTMQAKLLLKMGSHNYCPQFEEESVGGFRVWERGDHGEAISLGWQGRYLATASAWRCAAE